MLPVRGVLRAGFLAGGLFAAAGCAAPPDKEIHQALGAIEAARAAGAEQYAADELQAAVEALERARTAVDQRDYRLALNHALDARERAGDAARGAAAHRAEARSHADVLVSQVSQRVEHLRTVLDATRVPARILTEARLTADRADAALQEARAAVEREGYGEAAAALEGLSEALDAAIASAEGVRNRATRRPS